MVYLRYGSRTISRSCRRTCPLWPTQAPSVWQESVPIRVSLQSASGLAHSTTLRVRRPTVSSRIRTRGFRTTSKGKHAERRRLRSELPEYGVPASAGLGLRCFSRTRLRPIQETHRRRTPETAEAGTPCPGAPRSRTGVRTPSGCDSRRSGLAIHQGRASSSCGRRGA